MVGDRAGLRPRPPARRPADLGRRIVEAGAAPGRRQGRRLAAAGSARGGHEGGHRFISERREENGGRPALRRRGQHRDLPRRAVVRGRPVTSPGPPTRSPSACAATPASASTRSRSASGPARPPSCATRSSVRGRGRPPAERLTTDRTEETTMLLEGKVAIVSGIGPGMGRDIALALAAEGADIAMGARREKRMSSVAARSRRSAVGRCWCRPTSPTGRLRTAGPHGRDELGRVDILVNNAFSDGTTRCSPTRPGRLARDDRRQPLRHAAAHPGRAAVPQGAGRQPRHHDQHPVGADRRDLRGLLRVEGRARDRHQDPGPRARPVRRAGQRHPPQLHLGEVGRVVHQPHRRGAGRRSRWCTTSSPTRTA